MIRVSAMAGVPLCMFTSLPELTKGVMAQPDHALCFANREWTVVLVGSSLWGASLVATAKATGLYDAVSGKKLSHKLRHSHQNNITEIRIFFLRHENDFTVITLH